MANSVVRATGRAVGNEGGVDEGRHSQQTCREGHGTAERRNTDRCLGTEGHHRASGVRGGKGGKGGGEGDREQARSGNVHLVSLLIPPPTSPAVSDAMDAWLKTTKPMAAPARSKRPKPSTRAPVPSTSLIPINGGERLANKAFLGTLKDEDNPVTHSDAVSRSFKLQVRLFTQDLLLRLGTLTAVVCLQSCATGHQSGDSGGGIAWAEARVLKLQAQSAPTAEGKGVLKGVRVYINGYTGVSSPLGDPRGQELIFIRRLDHKLAAHRPGPSERWGCCVRIPIQPGPYARPDTVVRSLHFSASRCTHILSEQGLSGSKSQKVLTSKSKVRVVKPAWAVDSVTKGKRLNEARYAVVRSEVSRVVISV